MSHVFLLIAACVAHIGIINTGKPDALAFVHVDPSSGKATPLPVSGLPNTTGIAMNGFRVDNCTVLAITGVPNGASHDAPLCTIVDLCAGVVRKVVPLPFSPATVLPQFVWSQAIFNPRLGVFSVFVNDRADGSGSNAILYSVNYTNGQIVNNATFSMPEFTFGYATSNTTGRGSIWMFSQGSSAAAAGCEGLIQCYELDTFDLSRIPPARLHNPRTIGGRSEPACLISIDASGNTVLFVTKINAITVSTSTGLPTFTHRHWPEQLPGDSTCSGAAEPGSSFVDFVLNGAKEGPLYHFNLVTGDLRITYIAGLNVLFL